MTTTYASSSKKKSQGEKNLKKHEEMAETEAVRNEVNNKRKREEEDLPLSIKNRIALAQTRVDSCYSFKYGDKDIHEQQFDCNKKDYEYLTKPFLSSYKLVQDIFKFWEKGLKFLLEKDQYYRYQTVQNDDKSTKFIGKDDFLVYLLKHLSNALADDVVGIEDAGPGKIYLYYKQKEGSKKEKREEKDEHCRNASRDRIQLAKDRIDCAYSFKYGKAGLHDNEYDYTMCFDMSFCSDQLVKEILSYFEKGLKYTVPRDLFCYEVMRVDNSGKEVLRRIGFGGSSNKTFKYKLFEQLTHVLPKSVGVEEASDGTTYVYCD